jgi:hypothetical protein
VLRREHLQHGHGALAQPAVAPGRPLRPVEDAGQVLWFARRERSDRLVPGELARADVPVLHRVVAEAGPDEPCDLARQLLRCGAKLLEDDTVHTAQEEVGKGRTGGDHPLVTR